MWKSLLGLMPVSAADPLLTAQIFTPLNCFFMIIALFYAISPWRAFEWCQKLNIRRISVALILFVFACLVLFTQTYNPFLYFQF